MILDKFSCFFVNVLQNTGGPAKDGAPVRGDEATARKPTPASKVECNAERGNATHPNAPWAPSDSERMLGARPPAAIERWPHCGTMEP